MLLSGELHAETPQVARLGLDDALRQPELGDAVDQHPAGLVQRLEDGDAVPLHGQVGGQGKTGRAAAHHGDAAARARRPPRQGHLVRLALEVRGEAFERADGHGLALLGQHADLLALVVLGTDAAADGRQRVLAADEAGGAGEVAGRHELHEAGDVDLHRAAVHTLRLLALQAARRLGHGHLAVVAVADFAEVAHTQRGVLLRLLVARCGRRQPRLRLRGDGVPAAVGARAERQRGHARAHRHLDAEDRRAAGLTALIRFDQRRVTGGTADIVGELLPVQLLGADTLEDLQPRVDEELAGVTVAAQAETDPHPLGALVEDVERGVTAWAEAGEIALLLQRREIGVDGSHLSEP